MGVILSNNKEIFDKLFYLCYSMGFIPGPMDCYLAMRSLKTLPIRMEAIYKNAQRMAEYLETRTDIIEKVLYTGLPSHPQYEIA
jgi:cystathionine beta-lyase/cystathionine gamma-synthase